MNVAQYLTAFNRKMDLGKKLSFFGLCVVGALLACAGWKPLSKQAISNDDRNVLCTETTTQYVQHNKVCNCFM